MSYRPRKIWIVLGILLILAVSTIKFTDHVVRYSPVMAEVSNILKETFDSAKERIFGS